MKPKREDQRYIDTRAAIEEAVGFDKGESSKTLSNRMYPGAVRMRLEVWWGKPACHLAHSSFGPLLSTWVRPDWLERVHQQGLTMVDGVLVLHAEEAPPIEGAEAAWLCIVCVHRADWSEAKAQLTYVVKYAGKLWAGTDQQEAACRAIEYYADALGVEAPAEVKNLLCTRLGKNYAERLRESAKRRDHRGP